MATWIEKRLVLAIHDRQLAEHGGNPGVRDESLLDSALARPQQLHAYGDPPPDLAALAASLAFGLARNHAFIDGNKRTAHVCYRVFLAMNGVALTAAAGEKYTSMVGLAEGSVSEAQFAEWLRQRIAPAPGALHEPREHYAGRGAR